MESFKKILTKMKGQIKDSKDAEEKAKSSSAALQKQVNDLNKKLAEAPGAISSPKETTQDAAMVEVADGGAEPVEVVTAEIPTVDVTETADTTAQAAKTNTEPKATAVETTAKKKGKKRKGIPQKDAAATSTAAPPLKKTAKATEQKEHSAEATDKEAMPPSADSVVTAVDENKSAPAEKKTTSISEAASGTAASQDKTTPLAKETKQVPTTVAQSKPAEQQKKALPPKKMIKLTKTAQAQKQETVKDTPTSTSPMKGTTSTTENKEEELKKKMLLLKKRKAQMELKKASAKQKLEAKITTAPEKDENEKSSGSNDENNNTSTTEKPADSSLPKPVTTKPSAISKPLPPVPENDDSITQQSDETPSKPADEKSTSQVVTSPATLTFGSSTTVTGFGTLPAVAPSQSEPNCPKPSFFGASTTASTSVFGSGSTPAFGSTTTPGFGFGAKKTDEKTESPDATAKQPSKTEGAFLNLTPPGKTAKPSQFVFGKSSNITLPVPAPSPFGVFNQNNQKATPFSAFNINPPFGGGTGFGSAPVEKNEDSKTEKTAEEGEVTEVEDTPTQEEAAAKEA